jgi:hypothetical protein
MELRSFALGLALVLAYCFHFSAAQGYEELTHEKISEHAMLRSSVDAALSDFVVLEAGFDTPIAGQSIMKWLRQGADREDSQLRSLNHFHNPLAVGWSQAGLLGSVGQSAILWGQNLNQGAPSWSWQDVRGLHFDALTRSAKSERDLRLGKTFEGLGRLIHLVQDAASPAHARNDPHLLYNYESLVDAVRTVEEDVFNQWLAGSPDTPGVPDAGWRSLDPNPLAPVAAARLIDSDRYTGTNPGITTAALMGLAEYTNANFFSEDRIFTENDVDEQKRFPYPRRSSATDQDFEVRIKSETVKRRYVVKSGDGATGYRLAAVGFLKAYHQRFSLDWTRFREVPTLDEAVYRGYAERLLPRAVSYSSALLDYFFRGRMIGFGDDLSMGFRNTSDEAMDGTFTLYYDDKTEVRRPVPGATWTRTVAPLGVVSGLRVSPPDNPPAKTPGAYMLVFRGRLGTEPDAVVAKQVQIESVIFPRLVKRKDGTPLPGITIAALDVETLQVLSSSVTDPDGRARLIWRPGRTILLIQDVNRFPMYWSGGSAFSSGVEGARVVPMVDLDPQREVTIAIPIIAAEWPESIEACSGQPKFAHSPRGFFQNSMLVGEDRSERVTVTYRVNLITFIRSDNGQETALCGSDSFQCADPAAGFIADDINRIGQVVGRLVRNLGSNHTRQLEDLDGTPVGPPVCANEYDEGDVVPVTVAER